MKFTFYILIPALIHCTVVSAAINLIDLAYGAGAGSFELGEYEKNSGNAYDYMRLPSTSTVITGWTVGGVDGIDWCSLPTISSQQGSKSVDLSGISHSGIISQGSISTIIPTAINTEYLISFWAFGGNEEHTGLLTAGTLSTFFTAEGSSDPSTASYQFFSYSFTATTSETEISFETSDGYGFGPVIDNVSVVIPEPQTAIWTILLAVTLIAIRKRILRASTVR